MDYEGEQAMELEALEAIFPDDLEEYDGNLPDGWTKHGKTYSININPSAEVAADDEEEEPELQMQLVFAHTPTYPDEAPCIRLRSVKGLSDADLQEATTELQRHIEESMGMSMIYNLVTAAQEWLAARLASGPAGPSGLDPEAEEKRRREEEEQARIAARSHGHPVTVESFNEWRKKFEAEMAQQAAESGGAKGGDGAVAGRMTGKAWFMQQLAAGKVVSSSEEEEEGDEEFDGEEDVYQDGLDEDDEDEDLDYEDDDDEGLLDEYLGSKAS